MKTLLLLRHAKSSWDDPARNDHERPLNRRGERAAEAMGALLAEAAPVDLVLCSSSRRTRQTLDRILGRLPEVPAVHIEPDLYLASAETLLAAIRSLDDHLSRVLVVAHNPGTHELARALASSGEPGARDRLRAKLPTGALVELRTDAARWAEVAPGSMELRRFVTPRDLADDA